MTSNVLFELKPRSDWCLPRCRRRRRSRAEILIAEGIAAFNQGEYWEAHERWEQVWRRETQPRLRAHLKGMIQAAGTFVLLEKGRRDAAARLARRAQYHLAEAGGGPVVIEGLESLLTQVIADPKAVAAHLREARSLRARFEKQPALT